MRSYIYSLFFLMLCSPLAGCDFSSDPDPMGRGYSSYNKPYKSAPGPEARDIGYVFSAPKNENVLKSMRPAARDLVEQLETKISFGVEKIYLNSPADTAFYNSFDHVLRDELVGLGYQLSTVAGEGVEVEFVAKEINGGCKNSADKSSQKLYLALAIDVVNDVAQDWVGGFYSVPVYDYIPAGHVILDVPAKQCESDLRAEE